LLTPQVFVRELWLISKPQKQIRAIVQNYQWKINGANVGFNINEFSADSLQNGDRVSLLMTGNGSCLSNSISQSNVIVMNVHSTVLPSVTINPNKTSLCAGETINFNATLTNGGSNPVYQWKANGQNIGANSSSFSSSNLENDTQIQLLVQSNAACLINNSAQSNIVRVKVSEPPAANAGTDKIICAGASVTLGLTATTGNTYSWSPAGGLDNPSIAEPSAHPIQTTTYILTVTNNQGCSSTDQAVVTVIPVPAIPTVSTTGPTTFCTGSSVVLNSSSSSSNQWFKDGIMITGATGASYTAGTAGSYTVYNIVDGCISQVSAPVKVTVNQTPVVPTIYESSGVLTSSAASGNQWLLNGIIILGATA
jgi:hypothetical protein